MKGFLKIIALAVAALVLVAGAVIYYYRVYIPEKEAQLTMKSLGNSKPSIEALYSGQYSVAEASLRPLIKQAPTRSEEARLQELLMATLFDSGNESKMAEAASIAYNLVNDYSVPAWIRATTYNTLSRVVYAHYNDISFYATYLNKPPFDAYLSTSGTDRERMQNVYLKLLQVSDEIFPTSFAEYALANYYFGISLNTSSTQQTQEDLAKLMRKYVAEGDTRNDSAFVAPGATASLYPPYTIILNQLFRAQAIALSNTIIKGSSQESEEAYMRVKTVADSLQSRGEDMNNPKTQAVLFTWRFSYAAFLLKVFGDVRTSDIKTLLAPFETLTSQDAINFLENSMLGRIRQSSSTSGDRANALKLAAVSPEFKAFLIRVGVKF